MVGSSKREEGLPLLPTSQSGGLQERASDTPRPRTPRLAGAFFRLTGRRSGLRGTAAPLVGAGAGAHPRLNSFCSRLVEGGE